MLRLPLLMTFVMGTLATWNGPINTAATVGSRVTMSCQPSQGFDSIDWYHIALGSLAKHLISQGDNVLGNFRSKFSVSGTVAGQVLTLQSAEMKHAGIYACSAFYILPNGSGKAVESTAQLTILETDPLCTINKTAILKEGDYIEMQCRVVFNGSTGPVMQWKEHRVEAGGSNGSTLTYGHSDTVVKDSTVTSKARILVDYKRHNSSISCTTYFQTPPTSFSVNATNAPEYSYTWTSAPLRILSGPNRVVISPRQEVFTPGDVITCVAESSPMPEFEWRNSDSRESIKGQELVIRHSMIRQQPYEFYCKARNPVTAIELTSNSIKFRVDYGCIDSGNSNYLLIIACIAAAFILIVASLIVYIGILKHRNKVSFDGRASLREEAMLAPNINAIDSEYSEIPSYSVCREAIERCNYPTLPPINPAYLPMSNNSLPGCRTLRNAQEAAKNRSEHAFDNNVYMEPDETAENSCCPAFVPPSLSTSGQVSSKETPGEDQYADLSERESSQRTTYTTLTRNTNDQQDPGANNCLTEQDDYLEPVNMR